MHAKARPLSLQGGDAHSLVTKVKLNACKSDKSMRTVFFGVSRAVSKSQRAVCPYIGDVSFSGPQVALFLK